MNSTVNLHHILHSDANAEVFSGRVPELNE